jgi:hypothetical protein
MDEILFLHLNQKKIMKKMRLTALLALITIGVSSSFAQIVESPIPDLKGKPLSAEDLQSFNRMTETKLNKKATVTGWYNYTGALGDNGERFTYFTGTHMWPDSSPVIIFPTTGKDHISLHAIGQVFDPTSFYFTDPTPQLNQHNSFKVDSIAFFYKYLNLNGISDTLLVQFYTGDKIANLSFGGTTPTRSVVLNRATSTGQDATAFVKIPLDMTMNTAGFFETGSSTFEGVIQVPTPLNVAKGALAAWTATFIPGNYPVALGDTLAYDSTNIPQKKLNCFLPLIFRGDGAASGLDNSFNVGLFAFISQKYSTTTARPTEWFYPANAPGTLKQYVPSQFYINCGNVGIENLNKGYGLGVAYPNPVTQGQNVQVDFALGKSEMVSVELYDLLGKKVKNITNGFYAQGSHTVEFSVNELPQGVYVYQIKAGDFSSSRKLTVSK